MEKTNLPKILITGGSGFLGGHLSYYLSRKNYSVTANYYKNPVFDTKIDYIPLDITNKEHMFSILEPKKFDVIIHTAYEKSNRNGVILEGTENIVELAKSMNCKLIHISTDLIFSGKNGRYSEDDVKEPVMEYGKYKLEAEKIVQSYEKSAIIRTSLIYCLNHLPSHYMFIFDNLRNEKNVHLNIDELRNPVYVDDLNRFIQYLVDNFEADIFHFAGPEPYSRYEFGWQLSLVFNKGKQKWIKTSKTEDSELIRAKDVTLMISKARQFSGIEPQSVSMIIKNAVRCNLSKKRKIYHEPKVVNL